MPASTLSQEGVRGDPSGARGGTPSSGTDLHGRMVGVGALSREETIAWGILGPSARGGRAVRPAQDAVLGVRPDPVRNRARQDAKLRPLHGPDGEMEHSCASRRGLDGRGRRLQVDGGEAIPPAALRDMGKQGRPRAAAPRQALANLQGQMRRARSRERGDKGFPADEAEAYADRRAMNPSCWSWKASASARLGDYSRGGATASWASTWCPTAPTAVRVRCRRRHEPVAAITAMTRAIWSPTSFPPRLVHDRRGADR